MRLTDGFRLSNEQLAYIKKEFLDIHEKLKNGQVEGMFRLVARQESLRVIFDLHKLEVKRIEELGDNVKLADFVQNKEI